MTAENIRAVAASETALSDTRNDHRNPGIPFAPDMFTSHSVNRIAAERRVATLAARRSIKSSGRPPGSSTPSAAST